MRVFYVMVLVAVVSGCGKAGPTLAGGKPVDYWVKALHDPDPKVRQAAAFKLGNVGPANVAAFPALIGALKDRDAGVRCEVILALLKFGPEAKEAVPILTNIRQHDPDAKVRDYAVKALQRIEDEKVSSSSK